MKLSNRYTHIHHGCRLMSLHCSRRRRSKFMIIIINYNIILDDGNNDRHISCASIVNKTDRASVTS